MLWRTFLLAERKWCAAHENDTHIICGQCRPLSACPFAQADLDLRYQLEELMGTVVYIDEQRKPWSDCTDAHAYLDRRSEHLGIRAFSHVAHQVTCSLCAVVQSNLELCCPCMTEDAWSRAAAQLYLYTLFDLQVPDTARCHQALDFHHHCLALLEIPIVFHTQEWVRALVFLHTVTAVDPAY